MNNAGTVLLTLADMSVIQAEVEVDETNIPNVTLGQLAKITIDALPDRTFKGHVTEIGNSPIQTDRRGRSGSRAGDQLQGGRRASTSDIPDVRPGFTCTADITTATRKDVTAVPIPAVAVRELVLRRQRPGREGRTTDRRRRPSSDRTGRRRPRS